MAEFDALPFRSIRLSKRFMPDRSGHLERSEEALVIERPEQLPDSAQPALQETDSQAARKEKSVDWTAIFAAKGFVGLLQRR
jgi:hypothetical protein